MNKRKIIIDTDCGSDDAMAIAMALNEPNIDIMMISTVHGNVSVEQATINTLTTIEQASTYSPKVYTGSKEPLIRESYFAYETHGNDGMGDIGLTPKKLTPEKENAVIKLITTLEENPAGEIEIIALGPLTNLALAYKVAPDALKKVKRISLMGTAGLGPGNVTPLAEFNVWQDPEAAKIVFESGISLFVVGWDACLGESMLNSDDIAKIRNSSALGQFAIDCNRQLMELNKERFGENMLDMADPAAMAAIIHPECIKTMGTYYCEIDTNLGVGYGNAVMYDCSEWHKKANITLCSELQPDIFKNYLYETLCERQK